MNMNFTSSPKNRQYEKKINLSDQLDANFGRHRSGWSYVVQNLSCLHHPDGIQMDTFIERTFCWHPQGFQSHQKPWIGFIHVPPNIPVWFHYEQANDSIFQGKGWQQSYPHCLGLFTLSEYLLKSLKLKLDVPINNLVFPTDTPEIRWDWEKFIHNKRKKIIQVGWWLRKLHAIYQLPETKYEKIFLSNQHPSIPHLLKKEREILKCEGTFTDRMYETAKIINFLPNNEYDQLLSHNIVFLNLYDASASNTVIECMVRNTPVLINPIPSVVEYLGKDYPFYYHSLAEAEFKVNNLDLIHTTYQYLKDHPLKKKLTIEYFLDSLTSSKIYRSLNPRYSS